LILIFVREHNRLAQILAKKYPAWSDNDIYHEAKAINIAQWQTVVINEIIGGLLGMSACLWSCD
jgi:hypothetical protein